MDQFVPLSLVDATVSCWDAGGAAVFLGAPAHRVDLAGSFSEVLSAHSGRATLTTHHVNEEHLLHLERTWVKPTAPGGTVNPFLRGATYTLAIAWRIPGPGNAVFTHTRTYTGVTWQGGSWSSVGGHAFGHGQRFRATGMSE